MGRLMEQTIEEKQMDEGTIFAKEHIVELAKLIVDWQDSGLLGGGTHCLVDDLCNMLPGDSEIIKLRLAENIIKDICLQMIAFSTSEAIKKNLIQEKFRQEKFNKAFNDILKGSRQRYLYSNQTHIVSKNKSSRIEVLNSDGNWLIDYDSDPENSHFWYQEDRVFWVLRNKFSLQYNEMQLHMKNLIETQYNLKDVDLLVF